MIYGRITSNTAVRLFNAIISTGDEVKLQSGFKVKPFTMNDSVRTLVESLEKAATAAPDWIAAVSIGRTAVREFMDSVIL